MNYRGHNLSHGTTVNNYLKTVESKNSRQARGEWKFGRRNESGLSFPFLQVEPGGRQRKH